jgi:hypothetical protein
MKTVAGFRPRFTIRWLMVAVLGVALLTYLKISYERQPRYRMIAKDYATREQYAQEAALKDPKPTKLHHWVNTENGSAEISPDNVDHYRFMRQKYDRLARYPWLPLTPDPPEPAFDRSN